jgi:hypothetical protein
MAEEITGVNQETHLEFNREPGLAVIPGSNMHREMAKWEQFPSKWTEGVGPGRPYAKREFPKMVYKAKRYNGAPACMAAPPDPLMIPNPGEFMRAEAMAQRFNEECQKIVADEKEYTKAREMGYCDSPEDAVAWLISKDQKFTKEEAHRAYDDRNLSNAAQAEIKAAKEAVGNDPLPEIPEQPRARRGRPSKTA